MKTILEERMVWMEKSTVITFFLLETGKISLDKEKGDT